MKIDETEVSWMTSIKILVKGVVVNKSGKYLVIRRSKTDWRRPNCWDTPGGNVDPEDILRHKDTSGRGDEDDILVNALLREVKEETDLDVDLIKTIHSTSGFINGKFIIVIVYLVKPNNTNEVILSKEHTEFRWVTQKEFLGLEFGDDGGLFRSIGERLA